MRLFLPLPGWIADFGRLLSLPISRRRVVAVGLAAGLTAAVVPSGRAAPSEKTDPPKEEVVADPVPTPATTDADMSNRQSVEVTAKFVEFSGEALRAIQDQHVVTQGRVKELLDRVIAISGAKDAGQDAPAANFAITQLLPRKDYEVLIRTLNTLKGVDLLSAPRVTTRSGLKATVEITREFIYPSGFERKPGADGKIELTPKKFDKKNTGVTLTVEPEIDLAHKVVDLRVSSQLVALEGWVRMSDGQPVAPDGNEKEGVQPVFVTQALDAFISVPTDSVLVLGSLRRHPGTWYKDFSHAPDPARTESLVLTFVSLDLVESPPARPSASVVAATPTPAPSPERDKPPYGIPVPGKPGYVMSPFAEDAGYIDLRGFARDAEVRDPYTNKLIRVP